jgi:hypothetical protein
LKRTEREELVELRRENQRLRLEREILKNDRMAGSGIICWTRNSRSDYLGGEPGSKGRSLFGDLENPLKNMVWGGLRT